MVNLIMNFFRKKERPQQEDMAESATTDISHLYMNTEKYKKNLTTMNYSDLIDLIHHEESNPYKAHPGKEARVKHHISPQYNQPEYDEYILNENEDDNYPYNIEEEYSFVLVKKAKPQPTLVMPTKLLQQLDDQIQRQDS